MKTSELMSILEQSTRFKHDDPTIVVQITKPYGTCGASPSVEILQAYPGFDWDAGKILLQPAEPLQQINSTLSEQLAKTVKSYDELYYENQGIKAENRRLKRIIKDMTNKQD